MSNKGMNFDRYHPVMGNSSLKEESKIDNKLIADMRATFYVTQRKKQFAPCVGHERLRAKLLKPKALDIPWLDFLRRDKADLSLIANRLELSEFPFFIRAVVPGTIMFPNEPFADITGPFAETQMMEVDFEHAFDEPITVAGNALKMRLAAGSRHLSDFSLRRDGSLKRALEVAKYSYIGGFDDTSNMEAAFQLNLNAVGTMAHCYVEVFMKFLHKLFSEKDEQGRNKHFQQVGFERWLDTNPNGTTLLIDTIDPRLGMIHAIRAAKSSPKRRKALKFVRLDSGNLGLIAKWISQMLDANDLNDVGIIVTGDVDEKEIKKVLDICPEVSGFGVGTKLAAETTVAGVIYKLCRIDNMHTLKCSATPGKETIPGIVQVWRCVREENGEEYYVKDIISMLEEAVPRGDFKYAVPLLCKFYENGKFMPIPSPEKQKQFVSEQLRKFRDIERYPVELSKSLLYSKERLIEMIKYDEIGTDGVIVVDYPN
ncbi:MAG: hypothetical protein Q8R55_05795 [Candidatus Taylorbacteria bacterium]|nr:hypothetical protein [Candidatus Taylorbacteria bacterium]